MAELDTTYRTPRHRPGMDPNTRKLALIAGGLGVALVVMVGAWSLTGAKSGGIPVVEADSRPLRVKPDKTQMAQDSDDSVPPGKQALAPTPEAPKPEALKAQVDRAAADRAAAEKLLADKREAETAAEAKALADAAAPPPAAPAPIAAPQTAIAQAPIPARPTLQPVALTSPVAPAPAASPQQPTRVTPAPTASGTQVQLAAVTSEQAALSEWSRLEKRMPDILGGRRPAVVKAERDGKTFFRLRTGGFADTAQASSFCEKIRTKGGTCSVASF